MAISEQEWNELPNEEKEKRKREFEGRVREILSGVDRDTARAALESVLRDELPLVNQKYHQPITEMGWDVRVVRALRRRLGTSRSIPTLGEVAVLSDKELLEIRNFGVKALAQVRGTLKSLSV